jgi:hypothetical protein
MRFDYIKSHPIASTISPLYMSLPQLLDFRG